MLAFRRYWRKEWEARETHASGTIAAPTDGCGSRSENAGMLEMNILRSFLFNVAVRTRFAIIPKVVYFDVLGGSSSDNNVKYQIWADVRNVLSWYQCS